MSIFCCFRFSLLLAQFDRFLHEVEEDLHTVLGVVVARDGVGDHVGVAVGVHEPHRGDGHLAAVDDGAVVRVLVLVLRVHHHHQVRQPHLLLERHVGRREHLSLPIPEVKVVSGTDINK